MNTSASDSDSQRVRYLTQVLKLNPVFQAGEIVELRRKYLGLKSLSFANQTQGNNGELEERRMAAVRIIEQVRENFWQMPLNTLRDKLAGLKLNAFPDLKHAAMRLSVTAANRDVLPDLVQDKGFDSNLFSALKIVLVCSPRDAVSVKERFRKCLINRQDRTQAVRMIRLLKGRLPELYELEQDWLDSIAQYRPPKGAKSADGKSSSGFEFSFEGWGWFFCGAVVVAVQLIRYAIRHL